MTYKGKFKVNASDLKHYEELLYLDNFEDCTEEDMESVNARLFDEIQIANVTFKNGVYVLIDLCSGCSNYFDNIVVCDSQGNAVDELDCTYEIGDFEFDYNGDTYIVEMVVENDK